VLLVGVSVVVLPDDPVVDAQLDTGGTEEELEEVVSWVADVEEFEDEVLIAPVVAL